MAYDIGPRIGITGEKEFKDSLASIDKSFKTLSSEMKVVESQFNKNEKTTESLTAKKQVLAKEIDNQKERESLLTAQYAKQSGILSDLEKNIIDAKNAHGENSKEVARAQQAYDKQSNTLLDLQTNLNLTTSNLNQMEHQLKETNKELGEMAAKKLKDASEGLNKFGEASEKAGKKMLPATAAIAGAGVAAAKMASDFTESENKVEAVFGNLSADVKAWSKTTLDNFGIASGTALDMAALFGDMGTSMGLNTRQASAMSMELVGLGADLASFKNIGIDQASNALKAIFTGETESLKNLGVVMTQANLDAYALANGFGKTTKSMTEAEKVQLRYAYVMDKTKNAHGDFLENEDEAANSTRKLSESIEELATSFGQQLLPLITPLIQKATEFIKSVASLDAGTKGLIMRILGVVAVVGPLLIFIGKLSTGAGVIAGLIGKLAPLLFGTAAANTAVAGSATAAATSTGLLSKAFAFLAANPIVLVVAALAGFIVCVVAVIKNIQNLWKTNEEFKTGVLKIWGNIKAFFAGIGDWFVTLFTKTIPDALTKMKDVFSDIFQSLVDIAKKPINAIIGLINGAISGINSMIRGLNSIKIDIPKWVPKLGGKTFGFNISEIGKIPMLAKGGTLSSGSAIVGEAGAELLSMINGRAQVTPLTNNARNVALTTSGGDAYYNITISAKDVKEFNDIVRMAQSAKQQRRAR